MDKSKFLVSTTPVAREVEFADGTKDALHFKQASGAEFRRWRIAEASEDQDQVTLAMQMLIQASLCLPSGQLALTKAEAASITIQGMNDLFPHVLAVAGVERDAKKPSPNEEATTGSDTPSPLLSESP